MAFLLYTQYVCFYICHISLRLILIHFYHHLCGSFLNFIFSFCICFLPSQYTILSSFTDFFLNMIIFLQSRFLINLCFLFKKKYLVVNLIPVHRILYFDINSKWYINLKYFSLILFLILGLAKYT